MEDFEKIAAFIRKHHVMTLATCGCDGRPWVAHVFYAWMADEKCFVFTTDTDTRHGAKMSANTRVAAGIALETRTVGRVQGLQIEGEAYNISFTPDKLPPSAFPAPPQCGDSRASVGDYSLRKELSIINYQLSIEQARRAYLKRFPYAVAAPDLQLWILWPSRMKFTDNTLGFGKKLIWTANTI